MTFNLNQVYYRHITYQHSSFKLICPECNYVTQRKDNLRHHLINVHKLKKVGTNMDNLQRIKTDTTNAKLKAKAPKKPLKKLKSTTNDIKKDSKDSHMYGETLPSNKRPFKWTSKQDESPGKTKKFSTKPVTVPPECNKAKTTVTVTATVTPCSPPPLDNDLQNLDWLIHALDPPKDTDDNTTKNSSDTPIL